MSRIEEHSANGPNQKVCFAGSWTGPSTFTGTKTSSFCASSAAPAGGLPADGITHQTPSRITPSNTIRLIICLPSSLLHQGGGFNPPFAVVQHLRGTGCARARHADRSYFQQRVQRADSTGRLYPNVRRRVLAHELQVCNSRAPAAIARGSLDEVRPGFRADLTQLDLVAVLQVAVLEDHLHDGAARVAHIHHRADICANVVPVRAEHFSDIGDHVQLDTAIAERLFGFCYLHRRG